MNIIQVKHINYTPKSSDLLIKNILSSRVPFIISIPDFPNTFDLNYFKKNHSTPISSYGLFQDGYLIENAHDSFENILDKIILEEPYRIFGEILSEDINQTILKTIPFLNYLPKRNKYFKHACRLPFFFGGKGGVTQLHYDREKVSLLHLCLSGKKRFYLFLEDQNQYLYKEPFIGNSAVVFREPIEETIIRYPRLEKATCYQADLSCGDMLYMPRNCWHYTLYKTASAATCLSVYPKKIDQFLGSLTGYFFIGYHELTKTYSHPLITLYREHYCHSRGSKKFLLKLMETPLYLSLALALVPYAIYKMNYGKPGRIF